MVEEITPAKDNEVRLLHTSPGDLPLQGYALVNKPSDNNEQKTLWSGGVIKQFFLVPLLFLQNFPINSRHPSYLFLLHHGLSHLQA